MIINISPEELEPEFRESWKMGFITQPSIDYADNAIWAIFEGNNKYFISAGNAGITIRIESN